jgi:hypothetical protein
VSLGITFDAQGTTMSKKMKYKLKSMSLHAFEVKCLSFIKFYEKGWEEGSV